MCTHSASRPACSVLDFWLSDPLKINTVKMINQWRKFTCQRSQSWTQRHQRFLKIYFKGNSIEKNWFHFSHTSGVTGVTLLVWLGHNTLSQSPTLHLNGKISHSSVLFLCVALIFLLSTKRHEWFYPVMCSYLHLFHSIHLHSFKIQSNAAKPFQWLTLRCGTLSRIQHLNSLYLKCGRYR